ncbi:hypothetical protein FQA39_LY05903 [Lamprigera yunnana]|nr:hypothetical protein FQA39_LY05903 [Lamprigera yunnana]
MSRQCSVELEICQAEITARKLKNREIRYRSGQVNFKVKTKVALSELVKHMIIAPKKNVKSARIGNDGFEETLLQWTAEIDNLKSYMSELGNNDTEDPSFKEYSGSGDNDDGDDNSKGVADDTFDSMRWSCLECETSHLKMRVTKYS